MVLSIFRKRQVVFEPGSHSWLNDWKASEAGLLEKWLTRYLAHAKNSSTTFQNASSPSLTFWCPNLPTEPEKNAFFSPCSKLQNLIWTSEPCILTYCNNVIYFSSRQQLGISRPKFEKKSYRSRILLRASINSHLSKISHAFRGCHRMYTT